MYGTSHPSRSSISHSTVEGASAFCVVCGNYNDNMQLRKSGLKCPGCVGKRANKEWAKLQKRQATQLLSQLALQPRSGFLQSPTSSTSNVTPYDTNMSSVSDSFNEFMSHTHPPPKRTQAVAAATAQGSRNVPIEEYIAGTTVFKVAMGNADTSTFPSVVNERPCDSHLTTPLTERESSNDTSANHPARSVTSRSRAKSFSTMSDDPVSGLSCPCRLESAVPSALSAPIATPYSQTRPKQPSVPTRRAPAPPPPSKRPQQALSASTADSVVPQRTNPPEAVEAEKADRQPIVTTNSEKEPERKADAKQSGKESERKANSKTSEKQSEKEPNKESRKRAADKQAQSEQSAIVSPPTEENETPEVTLAPSNQDPSAETLIAAPGAEATTTALVPTIIRQCSPQACSRGSSMPPSSSRCASQSDRDCGDGARARSLSCSIPSSSDCRRGDGASGAGPQALRTAHPHSSPRSTSAAATSHRGVRNGAAAGTSRLPPRLHGPDCGSEASSPPQAQIHSSTQSNSDVSNRSSVLRGGSQPSREQPRTAGTSVGSPEAGDAEDGAGGAQPRRQLPARRRSEGPLTAPPQTSSSATTTTKPQGEGLRVVVRVPPPTAVQAQEPEKAANEVAKVGSSETDSNSGTSSSSSSSSFSSSSSSEVSAPEPNTVVVRKGNFTVTRRTDTGLPARGSVGQRGDREGGRRAKGRGRAAAAVPALTVATLQTKVGETDAVEAKHLHLHLVVTRCGSDDVVVVVDRDYFSQILPACVTLKRRFPTLLPSAPSGRVPTVRFATPEFIAERVTECQAFFDAVTKQSECLRQSSMVRLLELRSTELRAASKSGASSPGGADFTTSREGDSGETQPAPYLTADLLNRTQQSYETGGYSNSFHRVPSEQSCGTTCSSVVRRSQAAGVTQEDLEKVQLGNLLGRGAFGSVYMGLLQTISGPLMVGVKILPVGEGMPEEVLSAMQNELDTLAAAKHRNVVRLYGSVYAAQQHELRVFTEYVECGTVASMVERFGCLPLLTIQKYMQQILLGLEHMHSLGIMHRDIKGENILVTKKGKLKISDFGCSVLHQETKPTGGDDASMHALVGSPLWMAPEVIAGSPPASAADIWGVGCVGIEMLDRRLWDIKPTLNVFAMLFQIGRRKSAPDGLPSETELATFKSQHKLEEYECFSLYREFLLRCLSVDPAQRWSAEQLLRHPFMHTPFSRYLRWQPSSCDTAKQ